MTNGEERERFHPLYAELHGEPLMRPFPAVSGQVMVSHRAIFFTPEEAVAHRDAVAALAETPGAVATPESQGIQLLQFEEVELRIERHSEFTAFTIFAPQAGLPFEESAINRLPEGMLDAIPGKILAAVEIAGELVAAIDAGTTKTMERVHEYFDQDRLVGGWVVERVASVWSHFRPDERGATRFLVQIHRLTSGRYGRLLQRLVEIENYRLAATLGVSLAREVLPEIEQLESQIFDALLGDSKTRVAQLQRRSRYRLRRTASYVPLLAARVTELREEAVPGYQTMGEFFDRRLTPAWRLCETVATMLDDLSSRLATADELAAISQPGSELREAEGATQLAPNRYRGRHLVEAAAVVVATVVIAELLQLKWPSPSPWPWVIALMLALTATSGWRWWTGNRSRNA